MRRYISALLLIFGLITLPVLAIQGESAEETDGKIFKVQDFTSIINRTRADLEIHLGEPWKVEAAGNGQGVRNLRIFNRNGELIIRPKLGIFLVGCIIYRPVLITVCIPERNLEAVTLTGPGNAIIIGNLQSDSTTLKTAARGSISAEGDVEYLTLKSSASGNITFTGRCRDVDVKLTASGDANLKILTDNLKAKISSSGDMRITGIAGKSDIQLTARGNFAGRNFITDEADVRISGSGNAELRVVDAVDARLTAGGNLYYWGNPRIGEIRTSGRGRIERRE